MRLIWLVALLVTLTGSVFAQLYTDLATVSPTATLVTNSLCYSDGRDLACNGAAGLLVTSGTISIPTINATTISTTAGGVVSATYGYFKYISASIGLGAGTLASLTDVSATGQNTGMLLRYNGTKWEAVGASAALSTTTMVQGWPDAILCNVTTGGGYMPLYFSYFAVSVVQYQAAYGGNNFIITFNIDGSYSAQTGLTTGTPNNCISKSISQLIASGQTFNFIGTSNSSGTGLDDRVVSGTLLALANSATGYISLTTAGTTWGYLSSGANYLPSITTNVVSASNLSVSQNSTTCSTANIGMMRRSPTTNKLQICQDH